jgi:hypothetical protein
MVNVTGISNITSLQGLAFYTNNAVDGILFSGGIIVLFFVMLMVLLRNASYEEPFVNVLAVSSWSMFLISAFFWLAHLVPTIMPLGFLLLGAFSVLIMYSQK